MEQAIESDAGTAALTIHECYRCGKVLRQGWGFAFKLDPASTGQGVGVQVGEATKCILCALRHWPLLRRSLTVALVVGTVLTFLNQGDVIFAGTWKNALYWKIPLTYCVPFCVATFGALTNSRR